jgi:YcaO-like protein with predicted kinase domain
VRAAEAAAPRAGAAPATPPAPPPVRFRGREHTSRKAFFHGCQRTMAPAETLARIRPHFRRIGLTRLANVTGLDRIGIHTVVSVRPNSRYLSVDAGKGFTLEAAQVSAAMECIERYHGEQVDVPQVHAAYDELEPGPGRIPLELLPLSRHSLFSPRRPERWSMGWDLVGQREVAVPGVMVGLERQRAERTELLSFQASSNGLASGNTFLEAVTAGLLELVERDAVACQRVLEAQGTPTPVVRLDTLRQPLVADLLRRLDEAGVSVVLHDCTVDTGIPVYTAYLYDRLTRHVGIYRGYGAHLDPEIAMVRAITEAVQGRLIYITGSRDDFFRHNYLRLKLNDSESTARMFDGMTPTLDAGARPSLATPTFEGDLHLIVDRLRAVGLHQVIVLDLTLPEFDVSVVRVLCPGLEGYVTDYYAPGPRARSLIKDTQR